MRNRAKDEEFESRRPASVWPTCRLDRSIIGEHGLSVNHESTDDTISDSFNTPMVTRRSRPPRTLSVRIRNDGRATASVHPRAHHKQLFAAIINNRPASILKSTKEWSRPSGVFSCPFDSAPRTQRCNPRSRHLDSCRTLLL